MGTATPKQNGLAVLGKYMGVSATQTIVEYATFAILHLIGVPSQISNGIAVVWVVPEFLRTLVFARPRGDDQFADCTFSPSLDMSR